MILTLITDIGTFMGYYIGAQAKFDVKKPERQQAFISGEHEVHDLSEIMLKFLNEVVLCPVCGLPEILLSYESKKVMGKCRACGGNSEMPITNEKFKNYIQKNPPGGNTKTDKAAFKGNTATATTAAK
jgi:translation initiation factor 2 beta subunit (eIF-2beta)/eIF-5